MMWLIFYDVVLSHNDDTIILTSKCFFVYFEEQEESVTPHVIKNYYEIVNMIMILLQYLSEEWSST